MIIALAATTEELQNRISIFKNLQWVCGILAIAFLALTIFLFIRWRIWESLLQRTGLARKKSVSAMQERNAETGRLSHNSGAKIAAQEFTTGNSGETKKEKRARRTGEMKQGKPSQRLKPEAQPVQETSVLTEQPTAFAGKFVLIENEMIIHTDESLGG